MSLDRPHGDILGRGIAFPFHVGSHGGIAMASGRTDVEEAIGIILSTVPGERPVRPEFGCDVQSIVFEGLTASTLGRIDRVIRVALDRWEPRIIVEDVEFTSTGGGGLGGALFVHIAYRLIETNTEHNLIYPFYVATAEG